MKKHLFLTIPALFLATSSYCLANSNACQVDAQKKEIVQLFDNWNASLKTNDPQKVTEQYAPNAVLLPTVSNKPRRNHQEIKDYFVSFLTKKPQGELVECNIRKYDNIAINSGIYRFSLDDNGTKKQVLARYTYVYEKLNDQWKIIEHHSSILPEKN